LMGEQANTVAPSRPLLIEQRRFCKQPEPCRI
jgi:hypothetical protein